MKIRSITIPIAPMTPEATPAIRGVLDAVDPIALSVPGSGLIFPVKAIDKEKRFDSEKNREEVNEFESLKDRDEVNGCEAGIRSDEVN
jgi:hypothetical protein